MEHNEVAAGRAHTRRFITVALVAVAAAVGWTSVAVAHGGGDGPHRGHGVIGQVTAVDDPNFTVEKRDGDSVDVTTNADTQYRLTVDATVADATVGSFVIVKPDRDGDGDDDPSTVDADRIAIVPAPATPPPSDSEHRHRLAGTVTENDGSTLVVDTGDDDVTVSTDVDTVVTKTTVASFDDVQLDRYVKVHGERESEESDVLLARFVHIRLTLPPEPAHADEPAPASAAIAPAAPEPAVQAAAAETDTSTDDKTADTNTDPATIKVEGVVESLSDPTFTIHRRDGSTITVTTTSGTTYVRKQQDGTVTAGSFSDLHVGDRVGVEGTDDGNGGVTATRVLSGDCDRSGTDGGFHDRGGNFQRDGSGDWGDGGDGGSFDGRHR